MRLNICSTSHFIHCSTCGYVSLTIKEDSLKVWYDYVVLASVTSVSNRVIARKLERKQKKVEGGRGGEKRKRLPAKPTILENTP